MDVTEQLQAYITQLVALGQATLVRHRRGDWLPDELAAQAAALLALASELGTPPPDAAQGEAAAPSEPTATPGVTAILDKAVVAPPEPATTTPDEPAASGVAAMSPIEADNWLSALDEGVSSELLILAATDAAMADDELLVIDVDERPGGAAGALPPLVIDPIHDLSADSGAFQIAGAATEQALLPPAELRFCINCGTALRPGRRFCHQCGEPVAEMPADPFPEVVAPSRDAALPPPVTTLPREEWPTIVSRSPHAPMSNEPAMSSAPAMARFCNNCGLGLAADAMVCPDCGSRDIG